MITNSILNQYEIVKMKKRGSNYQQNKKDENKETRNEYERG